MINDIYWGILPKMKEPELAFCQILGNIDLNTKIRNLKKFIDETVKNFKVDHQSGDSFLG